MHLKMFNDGTSAEIYEILFNRARIGWRAKGTPDQCFDDVW